MEAFHVGPGGEFSKSKIEEKDQSGWLALFASDDLLTDVFVILGVLKDCDQSLEEVAAAREAAEKLHSYITKDVLNYEDEHDLRLKMGVAIQCGIRLGIALQYLLLREAETETSRSVSQAKGLRELARQQRTKGEEAVEWYKERRGQGCGYNQAIKLTSTKFGLSESAVKGWVRKLDRGAAD